MKFRSIIASILFIPTITIPSHQNNGFADHIAHLIPGIIGVGITTIGGFLLYDYYTRDNRLLSEATQFCSDKNDMESTQEALKILSNQNDMVLMMSSLPQGEKYRTIVKGAIEEQQQREWDAHRYYKELKHRKTAYKSRDQFYCTASQLQDELTHIAHQALQTRSILIMGQSLVTCRQLIDATHAYCKNIAILHNHVLARLQSYQHQLEIALNGIDNLKAYWLELDSTIKKTSEYLQEITKQISELVHILSCTQITQIPLPLHAAYEQEIEQLQKTEQELTSLIITLQKLQHSVGSHPRYAHDNELYSADYTRQLMQENQYLKDKVSSLKEVINNLEEEKKSLYKQISSLKDSIRSLEWQISLANNRPQQPQVIITQQR
jgi:predicted  nucleic acid-binding Zn-ribbon protein